MCQSSGNVTNGYYIEMWDKIAKKKLLGFKRETYAYT